MIPIQPAINNRPLTVFSLTVHIQTSHTHRFTQHIHQKKLDTHNVREKREMTEKSSWMAKGTSTHRQTHTQGNDPVQMYPIQCEQMWLKKLCVSVQHVHVHACVNVCLWAPVTGKCLLCKGFSEAAGQQPADCCSRSYSPNPWGGKWHRKGGRGETSESLSYSLRYFPMYFPSVLVSD